jgi:hypothetical protein
LRERTHVPAAGYFGGSFMASLERASPERLLLGLQQRLVRLDPVMRLQVSPQAVRDIVGEGLRPQRQIEPVSRVVETYFA